MPKIMQLTVPKIPVVVSLTKQEVDDLKNYCDEHLAVGIVEITQTYSSDTKYTVHAQVKDLPETRTDITDYDSI